MTNIHVKIENLTKIYRETPALEGVSIDIMKGELLAIVGPSGCGKTTLLRSIAGLEKPDSGSIYIGVEVVFEAGKLFVQPHLRRVGMVFQNYALWPHLTVHQNVVFPLKMNRFNDWESSERVKDVLSLVKLKWAGDRYPHQLSAGERQRVALARALVVDPELLLLDEPLSNLDAKLREEMKLEIDRIHRQMGLTIIHVTHDQKEAMSISDRIAVMNHGKVIQLGTSEEIYQHPRTAFIAEFFGRTNLMPCDAQKISTPFIGEPNKGQVLSVRPEDIEVTAKKTGLTGIVKKKTYLGNITYLIVETGEGISFWVQCTSRGAPRVGEKVSCRIKYATVVEAS